MAPWGHVIKAMLEAFAKLITDIPKPAKVILVFGIFFLLALVVMSNIRQVFVYDVEIVDGSGQRANSPFTVSYNGTETRTDENGRIKLVRTSGLLEKQRNQLVIKRPVVNVGEDSPRIRYGFDSKHWQSCVTNFSLMCDFKARKCSLEDAGEFEEITPIVDAGRPSWNFGLSVAHARGLPVVGLAVPEHDTLTHMARTGGYTEIRLSKLHLPVSYCRSTAACPGAMFADVEWNGVRLLFDGVEAAQRPERDLIVSEDGTVRNDLIFALENGLFGEGDNSLRVRFFSRGRKASFAKQSMAMATPAPVDVLDGSVRVRDGRPVEPMSLRSQRQLLTSHLEARVFPASPGRVFEVRAASGGQIDVDKKRDFINNSLRLHIQKRPLVAVVRPPLGVNQPWSLVVGIRDSVNGRIETLLSEAEAKAFHSELVRLAPGALGPLNPNEFAISRLALGPPPAAGSR